MELVCNKMKTCCEVPLGSIRKLLIGSRPSRRWRRGKRYKQPKDVRKNVDAPGMESLRDRCMKRDQIQRMKRVNGRSMNVEKKKMKKDWVYDGYVLRSD